jgi:hypothetical protein
MRYVLGPPPFKPDYWYAVKIREGTQGVQIFDSFAMNTGKSYECPPFKGTCTVYPASGGGGAVDDGGGGCDPSYRPCVPKHPPDLDCPDINMEVTVTGPDVHGLDREGDGIGCEGW